MVMCFICLIEKQAEGKRQLMIVAALGRNQIHYLVRYLSSFALKSCPFEKKLLAYSLALVKPALTVENIN